MVPESDARSVGIMTVEAPKHPNKHETHPPRVKKSREEKKKGVMTRFKQLWFYLCRCKLCSVAAINDTPCFI